MDRLRRIWHKVVAFRVFHYLFAIGISLLTILLKLAYTERLGTGNPLLLSIVPVIISALYVGYGPSLVSLLIVGFLSSYFFIPPYNKVLIESRRVPEVVSFFLVGLFVSYLIERQRKAKLVLQQVARELDQKVQDRTFQLTELNTDLERSNRELQEFASIASHDLQEPLRKIVAFGERLKESSKHQLNEESKDYLERLLNSTRRMQTLIEDLLTYSRVATKAQPFVMVHLERIVQEVLTDLEVKIEKEKAAIEVGTLPELEADPTQIRQVFQNLISNALKFKKQDHVPIISIRSELKKDWCTIYIKDNGIGLNQKYAEKIFVMFQRLHGRNEYEGTGIGLAVVRRIVERHGGTISVQSVEGEGAMFCITLPINHSVQEDLL